MSNLYALLIGIDFYFPNQLPGDSFYQNLEGCVSDVNLVSSYLQEDLSVPPAHIWKLTASNGAGGQPSEHPSAWPTYENMVSHFKKLLEVAQPGDQVYIHYSGNGARARTIFPDLKGPDGFDEALAPTDISSSNAHYLRDVELHKLFRDFVDKEVLLTIVFDCCQGGGATRGSSARERGIFRVDTIPRPVDSLVASKDELQSAWLMSEPSGSARKVKLASGWLTQPRGYTFLAACRAHESAYEYKFQDGACYGALTFWMIDTLRTVQSDQQFTYKMLHERVLAKVRSQFEAQTPQLQGAGDRIVFGSIWAGSKRSSIEQKSVSPPSKQLHRGVVIEIEEPAVRQQLEKAIRGAGADILRLTDKSVKLEFAVIVNAKREFEIQDPGDQPIPNLRPPIRVGEPGAIQHVVQRLVHLAKYRNVQALESPDIALQKRLGVRLSGPGSYAYGGVPIFRPGDIVKLEITNLQSTRSSAPNDPIQLNVTVLDLASDWSITQLYPSGTGNFEILQPGQTLPLELEAYVPEGYSESVDILKVFATTGTTQSHWLELPPLDQPEIGSTITSEVFTNPLETWLSSITGQATRSISLPTSAQAPAWTVAQVELRVRR
jgi:hypothetical protein